MSVMETTTAVDVLSRFAAWVRTASPTVEFTTYTTIDTYYDVGEVEATASIDLGEFGEQETTVTVYPGSVNVYVDEYEVEVSESVDVEEFVTDYSPVTASELADALTAAETALQVGTADLPGVETFTERDVARQILALTPPLAETAGANLDGAIGRILAEAFRMAATAAGSTVSAAGYDPLTVDVDTSYTNDRRSTVRDLRIGDDIIGESLGRVVRFVSANDRTATYVLNRNGRETERTDSLETSWDVSKVIPPTGSRDDLPRAIDLI